MEERNITYEIKEHLGVIKEYDTGWCKELNMISWNGSVAKYDIRDWDENHERMSRGITLHPSEMRCLVDLYISCNNQKILERKLNKEHNNKENQEEDCEKMNTSSLITE